MNTASKIHLAMVDTAMAKDFAALRALYHDDYTYTGPDGAERKGADAAVEVVETYTSAFLDYAVSRLHHYQPSDDVSILEYRATGTHQAETPLWSRSETFRGNSPSPETLHTHTTMAWSASFTVTTAS